MTVAVVFPKQPGGCLPDIAFGDFPFRRRSQAPAASRPVTLERRTSIFNLFIIHDGTGFVNLNPYDFCTGTGKIFGGFSRAFDTKTNPDFVVGKRTHFQPVQKGSIHHEPDTRNENP